MSDTQLSKAESTEIAFGEGGLVLTNLGDMYRFAKYVIASGLAPKQFDTPEKILVAMQYGKEINLQPMEALRSIAVINGRPSIYGDALPKLVLASGKCEIFEEWAEGKGDDWAAYCKVKRTDMETVRTEKFSIADAKRAKLWGKSGPWTNYPQRMLKMRARAFAFRDMFSDVLAGFHTVEEVRDYEPIRPDLPKVTPISLTAELEVTGDELYNKSLELVDESPEEPSEPEYVDVGGNRILKSEYEKSAPMPNQLPFEAQ